MSPRSMAEVLNEIDRWEKKLPAPTYGGKGEELFSSKMRRAALAFRLTEEAEKAHPEQRAERLGRMARNEALDIQRVRAQAETDFWESMPEAMRGMGLAEQEIHAMAGIDISWPACAAVLAWMGGPKLFLTLGGPPGGGKTLAATRCLMEAKEWVEGATYAGHQWRPRWARLVKAPAIARLSYYDKNDQVYLERLRVVRWLVIDDLGSEAKSDAWLAMFAELIDERARHERRTIITTNLPSNELRTTYDARVWRRLVDFGDFAAAKKPEPKAENNDNEPRYTRATDGNEEAGEECQ